MRTNQKSGAAKRRIGRGDIPVSMRVPASERTSQRLHELLGDLPDGEALSEVMKLGMRKIVEEAL